MQQKIKDVFKDIFKYDAERVFFAPGRVNMIGEHIDYNGGYVFPCALSFGTYAAVAPRKDNKINFYSANFVQVGIIQKDITETFSYDKQDDWTNYPKGMINEFKKAGFKFDKGFDIVYHGNIPNGASLSSSASLEVLTGVVLKDMYGLDVDMVKIALMGQQVENKFIGLNSGIMDQFIIATGKKNNAVLLDCNTLKYEYVPLVLKDASIVVMNTNTRRELVTSKYNERRGECEAALKDFQTVLPEIKALCAMTAQQFENNKKVVKDPVALKRAKHAVYENIRVLDAVKYLNEGDIKRFGKLMNESHKSLKEDYEVTGPQLDAIVEAAWEEESCIGARMTGAGFAGCAVAIVKNDGMKAFKENVARKYNAKTGLPAEFYVAQPWDGAKEVK